MSEFEGWDMNRKLIPNSDWLSSLFSQAILGDLVSMAHLQIYFKEILAGEDASEVYTKLSDLYEKTKT